MSATIKVRIVHTKRDGYILKWCYRNGTPGQTQCLGSTQRAREASRKRKERELNDQTRSTTWAGFYDDYKSLHLGDLSKSHLDKSNMMERRLVSAAKRLGIAELMCSDVCPKLMMKVEAEMLRSDVERSTINSNLGTLWAIVTWGQDRGMVPDFRRPRKRRGKSAKQQSRRSKGRALTGEEFDRLILAIPKACKTAEDPVGFIAATHAAKFLGMRKSECWLFSWEPMEGTHYPVRLGRSNPAIVFSSEQKSGEESEVPITPEADAWLRALPRTETPWVCRTKGSKGWHNTPDRLGRVVADAGRLAGIVVKRIAKKNGEIKTKNASLHDMRRTYAKQMMQFLDVADTTKMTRHADASVLLDFYGDSPTPELFKRVSGGLSGGFSGDESPGGDEKTR